MKVGIRTPSIKKSISARTTGRAKRTIKKLTNPFYGKKGMGWIKNPKKALYNKVYRKTTISAKDSVGCLTVCIWYPIYFSCILLWLICKYVFLGLWWCCVALINAIISVVEWFINRNAVDTEDTIQDITEAPLENESSETE